MKPITVINGPYSEGGSVKIERAYLVSPSIAMYVSDGNLWLDRVIPVPGRLFETYVSDAGIILTEEASGDAESLIATVYAALRSMDAFEFVTSVLLEIGIDLDRIPLPPDEAPTTGAET
ncbi:hypothetical protein [Paenibacillus sp. Leaf72]|uniref:hypothetical protein n=1 Tax=Paenibacillus sp. Leaf72 TaxID=1736234 RepID=UPI0006FB594A|nr:hypothetical protein [Paenibacillus sp. Leaf72]KQN97597.1 hypothetical protein ASF12_20505 [Paenibacillus sp. Leaf72]